MTITTVLMVAVGLAVLHVVLGQDIFRTMVHTACVLLLLLFVLAVQGLVSHFRPGGAGSAVNGRAANVERGNRPGVPCPQSAHGAFVQPCAPRAG